MQNRILRLPQVKEATGISRGTIYRLMAQGDFPKNVKLSPQLVGWREQDIQSWIESRA